MLRQFVRFIAAALAFGACGVQAQPQTGFPVKPVRIVIPYPAGGPVDAAGRQIAKGMQVMLKQPVIVDNKPGASSTIGSAEVARAPADGHTVLLTLADSFTYVPHLFKKLPYDPFNRPLKKCFSNASGTLSAKTRAAQTRLRSDCNGPSGRFAGPPAHFGRTYPWAHA